MKYLNILVFLGIIFQVDCAIRCRRDAEMHPTYDDYSNCFKLGDFLPAYNPTSKAFECFLVATRGPCQEGEWFLLNPNTSEQTQCYPRDCEKEEEVIFEGNCVRIGSVDQCPEGMEIYPDAFGEAHCQCREGFVKFDGHEKCFQINTLGPCSIGQQVVQSEGEGECEDSNCSLGMVKWSNGECYFLPNSTCKVVYSEILEELECYLETDPDDETLAGQTLHIYPSSNIQKSSTKTLRNNPKNRRAFGKLKFRLCNSE